MNGASEKRERTRYNYNKLSSEELYLISKKNGSLSNRKLLPIYLLTAATTVLGIGGLVTALFLPSPLKEIIGLTSLCVLISIAVTGLAAGAIYAITRAKGGARNNDLDKPLIEAKRVNVPSADAKNTKLEESLGKELSQDLEWIGGINARFSKKTDWDDNDTNELSEFLSEALKAKYSRSDYHSRDRTSSYDDQEYSGGNYASSDQEEFVDRLQQCERSLKKSYIIGSSQSSLGKKIKKQFECNREHLKSCQGFMGKLLGCATNLPIAAEEKNEFLALAQEISNLCTSLMELAPSTTEITEEESIAQEVNRFNDIRAGKIPPATTIGAPTKQQFFYSRSSS